MLERQAHGKRSEKMPRVEKELGPAKPKDPEASRRRREERAEARKKKVRHQTTVHPVVPDKRTCPSCGNAHLHRVGEGKESVVYEYVPAHFVAHRHVRETLACRCGEYVITAKCADSIPVHRQEKELQRIGVPVARSTMTELFHRAAGLVEPLVERLAQLIREAQVVHGDETPKKVLAPEKCKRGYVCCFTTRGPQPLVLYRFAMSRSGQTPEALLGDTCGKLVVDAYTGYNAVTGVEGRQRAGCWAHARRGFFDALATAPAEARQAMDFILRLYAVERDAEAAGKNLAGLYSLVATCEANGVNPVDYLTDILGRLSEHPNARLDELLPHNWRGPPDAESSRSALN